VAEQELAADPERKGNRGHHRYSCGGRANKSDHMRAMTGVSYLAPWFRYRSDSKTLTCQTYEQQTPRGQEVCRYLVQDSSAVPGA
jgi:hypothetical protein